MDVDGVQVPRLFVSAHSGAGLPALRSELARRSGSVPADMSLEAGAELDDAPG